MGRNYIWVIFVSVILVVGTMLMRKKKRKLSKNVACRRDKVSKEYAEKIVTNLHRDLEKIYPDINTILKLTFGPLECCELEDSVTEDKKRVHICVKNKNGKYYNYNKLMQVAIHELAHVLSKTVDPEHKSPEFINNYGALMNKAQELGLIDVSKLDQRV